MNRVPALLLSVLSVFSASFAAGCVAMAGHSKEDEGESKAASEAEAADSEAELPAEVPEIDVIPEGFGDTAVASVGDIAAEGGAILVIAALITSIVHLFRHRLPLLGFLTAVVAVLLAGLAFVKAWS